MAANRQLSMAASMALAPPSTQPRLIQTAQAIRIAVTEVAPAGPFWEAEAEHQDYLELFPNGYTCHFPRPGWKLPKRAG